MQIKLSRAVAILVVWMLPAPTAIGQVIFEVRNTIDEPRVDEVVAFDLAEIRSRIGAPDSARLGVIDAATGESVPSQPWDEDMDGHSDQLLVLASFWPNESRRFSVTAGESPIDGRSRAYASYVAERDDVAWESDRIAYRAYGQGLWTNPDYDPLVSSGIDVWLKRTRDLIIDRWYGAGHDAYHADHGEGADFFSVGPTLGAGGSAVWMDDTLYRAKNFKEHKILATGPIRAAFELSYEPWSAGPLTVRQSRLVAIDAGQNLYRETLVFQSDSGEPVPFAVGFVKRREGIVGSTRRGDSWSWLSTWGPVERKNGGHGELGSAVILPTDRLDGFEETKDHYLALSSAASAQAVTHYVGSGWTASGDFRTVEDWWAYLDHFVRRLEEPLRITIIE